MLGYFPAPYEDELFYSVIARYHMHSGNTSVSATVKELFGDKRITAIIDFPYGLNHLISNMQTSWDVKFEDLVYNNTLFPFYQPFWPIERANSVLEMMRTNPGSALHIKSGVNSNTIACWKHLKFCPACLENDEKRYGEAYWRRLHQVPGVLVCPEHKELILDSLAPVYGINPQYFQPADRKVCKYYSSPFKSSATTMGKLVRLSKEVMNLLKNSIPLSEYNWYLNSYKRLLQHRGLVSQKGYINQNALVTSFIEYYTPELLTVLGLMPDIENSHNWVSMMVRKSKDYPHPIEHILFIMFLVGSISEFHCVSSEPMQSTVNLNIRKAYPCLNVAADHYKQFVVTDIEVNQSRNKNLIATYKCSCGFSYSRMYSDSKNEDIFRYDTVKSYGGVWKNKFRELVSEKQIHLREVARLMGIDLKTVRKQVSKLNLESKWVKKKFNNILPISSTRDYCCTNDDEVRGKYRARWLSLLSLYQDLPKTKIIGIDRSVYYWLNKYDNEWLNANLPYGERGLLAHKRIDWEKRDLEIREKAECIANKLLSIAEKPVRITDYRIGKELGLTYLLRNNLGKLPLTKKLLESVCEDVDSYRVRRIKLAVNRLKDEGKPVKPWVIRQMTGLSSLESSYIDSVINAEMSKVI